ncbi:odorant receptor 13a-like [Athalia rosae]|uniref:odorant receptor 13a-like n=1 Tax=Athalia rosae TaxID=37344 RepID=UPI0020344DDC|nr:odorant receptor 13a-like [Athalia rosae]
MIIWNSDAKSTLNMYKLNLTFLGVWPFQYQRFRLGVIIISQITIAIPQYIDLVSNLRNLDNTIENLTCNVVVNMVVIKLITLVLHRESMADCINFVAKDWNNIRNIEARQIMENHRGLGKIVFFGLMSLLYISYIMYLVLAIVKTISTDCTAQNSTGSSCKLLPIRANYLIDTNSSPIYEIVFILQTVQGMITCTGNYGIDALIFFLTMHVCGQLELLKIDFRTLLDSIPETIEHKPNAVIVLRKKIVALTKRHYELIRFSEHLEDTFNIMILGQLLVSSVMICIIGFQFILCLENGDLLGGSKYVLYMWAVMMQLLLYSFAGDHLKNQSFGLAYAAYESQWYKLPPAIARDLLFVMVRAGNPLRISAGKFFIMTLESFKVIVKTSGSYLSVLRVMVD